MAVITIGHIKRRSGGDEERTEIGGEIKLGPGRQTLNIGTFKLNVLTCIQFTPKSAKRTIFGSISSPNIYGKTIVLYPAYAGTTGTRAVTSIGAIGSATASGSSSFYFLAHGW